jgi:hypothetical protein
MSSDLYRMGIIFSSVMCIYKLFHLFQISSVKRLVPRLKSLKFRSQYSDAVQDTKPVRIHQFNSEHVVEIL